MYTLEMQINSKQQNTHTTKIKIQGANKEEPEEAKRVVERIIEKRTNEETLKKSAQKFQERCISN